MITRRTMLAMGGGGLATLFAPAILRAAGVEVIAMQGSPRGEHVWFSPKGIAIPAGTTLRFVNRDSGNSHTSTAYHPAMFDRPLRIPTQATPWNSDLLLPGQSFEMTLTAPGVYDYYCMPHEMAGMVGRIVVGRPGDRGWENASSGKGDLPEMALAAFPPVEAVLKAGKIEAEEAQ